MISPRTLSGKLLVAFVFTALLTVLLGLVSVWTLRSLNQQLDTTSEEVGTALNEQVDALSGQLAITDIIARIRSAGTVAEIWAIDPAAVARDARGDGARANLDLLQSYHTSRQQYLESGDLLAARVVDLRRQSEQLRQTVMTVVTELTTTTRAAADEARTRIAMEMREGTAEELAGLSETVQATLEDVVLVLQLRTELLEMGATLRAYADAPTEERAESIRESLATITEQIDSIPDHVAGMFELMEIQATRETLSDMIVGRDGFVTLVEGGFMDDQLRGELLTDIGASINELDAVLADLADNTVFDGTQELGTYLEEVNTQVAGSLDGMIATQEQLDASLDRAARLEQFGLAITGELNELVRAAQEIRANESQAALASLRETVAIQRAALQKDLPALLEELRALEQDEVAAAIEAGVNEVLASLEGREGTVTVARELVTSRESAREAENAVEAFRARTSTAMRDTFQDLSRETTQSLTAQVNSSGRSLFVVLVIALIIVVLSLALGIIMPRGITRTVKRAVYSLRSLAENLNRSATAMSESSQTMATSSSEQAATVEESSSTVEEIASMAAHNATSARKAAGISRDCNDRAQHSNERMEEMARAMKDIHQASDQISNIIRTINDIAFQTNILALNAAVEAARAGEAGAGFAVVADEVRNLAMKSTEAARETEQIIETNASRTREGVEVCSSVQAALAEITAQLKVLDSEITNITQASDEQSTGLEQINKGIHEISRATQDNAAVAEEGASTANELEGEARNLQDVLHELSELAGVIAQQQGGHHAPSLDEPRPGRFLTDEPDEEEPHARETATTTSAKRALPPRSGADHKPKTSDDDWE